MVLDTWPLSMNIVGGTTTETVNPQPSNLPLTAIIFFIGNGRPGTASRLNLGPLTAIYIKNRFEK